MKPEASCVFVRRRHVGRDWPPIETGVEGS